MRVYVLLLTCLFFSLLGKPQQPRMMYEDTSRRGVPFSKDPHVVNFQGRYLMYYTLPPRLDVSGSGANIGIASSKDLVNWSKVGEITPEKNAVYEKNGLCAPGALVRDGKIHLFYQTYGNGKNDAICHAVSTDGIHFDRDPSNPVFHPTGDWNCGRAIDAEVCEFNGKYFLYFATRDKDFKINTWREDKFERSVANGTETVFVTLRFCVVRKQLKATLKPNAAGVQLPPHYYRNG